MLKHLPACRSLVVVFFSPVKASAVTTTQTASRSNAAFFPPQAERRNSGTTWALYCRRAAKSAHYAELLSPGVEENSQCLATTCFPSLNPPPHSFFLVLIHSFFLAAWLRFTPWQPSLYFHIVFVPLGLRLLPSFAPSFVSPPDYCFFPLLFSTPTPL